MAVAGGSPIERAASPTALNGIRDFGCSTVSIAKDDLDAEFEQA